jgi:serine/threonine-protein kinase
MLRAPLAEGAILGGRYRLVRRLGSGATSEVFEARHVWTDQPVAIKVLASGGAMDTSLAARFVREARSAAHLVHSNVVRIVDVDRDAERGDLFMVQELITGGDLEDYRTRRGRLSESEAISVLLPIMRALAHSHACGIVHRDVKPSNVVLAVDARTGRPIPKLIDFGLSKITRDAALAERLTRTGVFLGTPAYVAPEQILRPSDVGPPADVWAMGVMFYEALAGRLPFDGDTLPAIVAAILSTTPRPLGDVVRDVRGSVARAVHRAIDRDLAHRFATMEDFISALDEMSGSIWLGETEDPLTQTTPDGEIATEDTAVGAPRQGAEEGWDDPTIEKPLRITMPAADRSGPLRALATGPLKRRGIDDDRPEDATRPAIPLRFGFSQPPRGELTRASTELGQLLGLPVALVQYRGAEQLASALSQEEIEIGWLPPVAYARARATRAARAIAGIARGGHASYAAALLGGKNVPSLDRLRGARAAWVDPWSAAGCVVPRAELARLGHPPDRVLSEQLFVGSYDAAHDAVVAGRADVCAALCNVDDQGNVTERHWAEEDCLHLLMVSRRIPCEVLAIAGYIEEEIASAIASRLLRRAQRRGLGELGTAWGVSALVTVDEPSYDPLTTG